MSTERFTTRAPFTEAELPRLCRVPLGRAAAAELTSQLNWWFGLTDTVADELCPPSEPATPLTDENVEWYIGRFIREHGRTLKREWTDDARRDDAAASDAALVDYLDWALARFRRMRRRFPLSEIPAWCDPEEEIRVELISGMRASGLREFEAVGREATIRKMYATARRLDGFRRLGGRLSRYTELVNLDPDSLGDDAELPWLERGICVGDSYQDNPEQWLIDTQAQARSRALERVLGPSLTPAQRASWDALKPTLWKNKAGAWRFNKVKAAKLLPIDHTTVSRHALAIRDHLDAIGARDWISNELDLEVA